MWNFPAFCSWLLFVGGTTLWWTMPEAVDVVQLGSYRCIASYLQLEGISPTLLKICNIDVPSPNGLHENERQ